MSKHNNEHLFHTAFGEGLTWWFWLEVSIEIAVEMSTRISTTWSLDELEALFLRVHSHGWQVDAGWWQEASVLCHVSFFHRTVWVSGCMLIGFSTMSSSKGSSAELIMSQKSHTIIFLNILLITQVSFIQLVEWHKIAWILGVDDHWKPSWRLVVTLWLISEVWSHRNLFFFYIK
jgi:hypothetical protein